MECPNGHGQLQKMLLHQVEVDYCPECLGVFFEHHELAEAKNDTDNQITWLDFDIWRDRSKFSAANIDKRCPACRIAFVEVAYDDSSVRVDFCKHCKGVWLDRGEFKQIMVYLKKKFDYEILHRYTKNLAVQLWEVFTGPESFREELGDFLVVAKLLNYKLAAQHPHIETIIDNLPK